MRTLDRIVLLCVAAAAYAGESGAARATEAEVAAPAAPKLTREWIGFELTPASMPLVSAPADSVDGSVSRLQAGPGLTLRFLRHRGARYYVIPIQAGLYVSEQKSRTIFAHVETEAGVIVPGTERRLELGLGAGLGVLSMTYSNHCDGSCTLGGAGFLVSAAARYLLFDGPTATIGVALRAVVPLERPDTRWFGYFTGYGATMLAAFDVGFGGR